MLQNINVPTNCISLVYMIHSFSESIIVPIAQNLFSIFGEIRTGSACRVTKPINKQVWLHVSARTNIQSLAKSWCCDRHIAVRMRKCLKWHIRAKFDGGIFRSSSQTFLSAVDIWRISWHDRVTGVIFDTTYSLLPINNYIQVIWDHMENLH